MGGIFIISSILVAFFAIKIKYAFIKEQKILNVFTIIFFILLCIQVIYKRSSASRIYIATPKSADQKTLPNIYHILLDAYSNSTVLKEVYNYDNTPFYEALEDKGFLVFRNSYSNYFPTEPSVSSMLNMEFHKMASGDYNIDNSFNSVYFRSKIKTNKVWQILKEKGYDLHVWANGLPSDGYNSPLVKNLFWFYDPCDFWIICFARTPAGACANWLFFDRYIQNHVCSLKENFEGIANAQAKFSSNNQYFYTHILSPHSPLAFDESGEIDTKAEVQRRKAAIVERNAEDSDKFKKGYVNQVKAISRLARSTIDQILSQYPKNNQPIIILHSDHGFDNKLYGIKAITSAIKNNQLSSSMKASFSNLLAVYFPAEWIEEAKNLKFINLYRFILNHLFGLKYEYLPSRHFQWGLEIPHHCLEQQT